MDECNLIIQKIANIVQKYNDELQDLGAVLPLTGMVDLTFDLDRFNLDDIPASCKNQLTKTLEKFCAGIVEINTYKDKVVGFKLYNMFG